jgi:hypothetical protein
MTLAFVAKPSRPNIPVVFTDDLNGADLGAQGGGTSAHPSSPRSPRADYFKVLGANPCEHLLKHDLETGVWFLGRKWPARWSDPPLLHAPG